MKRQYRLWLVLGLAGLGLLLVLRSIMGYGAYMLMERYSPTLSPDLALLFQVELHPEDLPPGWYWRGTEVAEVPGGEGRFTWFYHSSARNLRVVHLSEEVLVHPDVAAAQQKYKSELDTYLEWQQMPMLQFPQYAEEAHTACLELYFQEISGEVYHHYACTYIARYKRVVIVVQGHVFDDRWLTMSEFREVLIAADRRAAIATGLITP